MKKDFDEFVELMNSASTKAELEEAYQVRTKEIMESHPDMDVDKEEVDLSVRMNGSIEVLFYLRKYHEWVNS